MSIEKECSKNSSEISISFVVWIILIILKAFGAVELAWWIVLLGFIWIPFAIAGVILLGFAAFGIVVLTVVAITEVVALLRNK